MKQPITIKRKPENPSELKNSYCLADQVLGTGFAISPDYLLPAPTGYLLTTGKSTDDHQSSIPLLPPVSLNEVSLFLVMASTNAVVSLHLQVSSFH